MPLKELADLYDRVCSNKNTALPYYGLEEKKISFIIVIDNDGEYIGIRDTRVEINNYKIAKKYCIPKSIIRTSGVKANLLWDKYIYVFQGNPKYHEVFKQKIKYLPEDLRKDKAVNAVNKFYNNKNNLKKLENSEEFKSYEKDLKTAGIYISFQLIDEPIKLCCQSDAVINWQKNKFATRDKEIKTGTCIVTGKNTDVAEKHFPIQLPGSSNNMLLASVNIDAAESYNKKKGDNFQISDQINFKYNTTLQYLLNSQQKIKIGDMILVFWAKDNHILETSLSNIFCEDKYNINLNSEKASSYFNSVYSGAFNNMEDDKNIFYMLGLSPGKARIAINFWKVESIANINKNIKQWFKDLELSGYKSFGYPSLSSILYCMQTSTKSKQPKSKKQEKENKTEKQLLANFMLCIFYNTPLPLKYLNQCLLNIHLVDDKTFYQRACFIKAFFNMKLRKNNIKEIKVSLDVENTQIGYLLGRLFAVYEQLQQESHNRKTNTNLKSRYYLGLSNTPNRILPILDGLANIYLDKLRKNQSKVAFKATFDKVIEGIYSKIPVSDNLPTFLDFNQRSLFVIGYQQQKAKLKSQICTIKKHQNENDQESSQNS